MLYQMWFTNNTLRNQYTKSIIKRNSRLYHVTNSKDTVLICRVLAITPKRVVIAMELRTMDYIPGAIRPSCMHVIFCWHWGLTVACGQNGVNQTIVYEQPYMRKIDLDDDRYQNHAHRDYMARIVDESQCHFLRRLPELLHTSMPRTSLTFSIQFGLLWESVSSIHTTEICEIVINVFIKNSTINSIRWFYGNESVWNLVI